METRSAWRLAETALSVARDAARILLAGYRSRPAATEKARWDLVTEFDVKSERRIRELLLRETPEVAIVAEEGGGTASGLTWFVDPLDGTMNFVHGHPFFCVSIGAMEGGKPVAGAVVAPVLGVEWWGGPGLGAFRNGSACHVSDTATLEHALLATGFPPDRVTAPGNNFASFEAVQKRAQGVRRDGSAALDCCFVADGTFDGYWERALHAWDVAAGAAIALGGGARLTSFDGGAPDLSAGHLVLTNGRIHEELRAVVNG
ncbi:MAG TPA: inositol monophosphatase family protein [Polyangiaceae bacterium]|nr:inositol monophosphatase family protein [Polyangiaceae bacterium]